MGRKKKTKRRWKRQTSSKRKGYAAFARGIIKGEQHNSKLGTEKNSSVKYLHKKISAKKEQKGGIEARGGRIPDNV